MIRPLLILALVAPAVLAAQEPADRVYELADVETAPVPANLEELRAALESTYPPGKRDVAATVSVAFVLGPDGVPREVGVTESTDTAFDAATVGAIGRLRFSPATVQGRPVAVRVEVPVQWEPSTSPPALAADSRAAADSADSADSVATAGEPRVYSLARVDSPPRPTNVAALRGALNRHFPARLRDHSVQAVVQVRFVVTERGAVIHPRVTHTTDARFDAATLEAVRVLRFIPGRIDGRPVRTWVEIPIEWANRSPR